MTRGAVFPLLFSFTMPLLSGNLFRQTYSLINAATVGKFLGINLLAAVGASTLVILLILGLYGGCYVGLGIPVAQKFGARDHATIRCCVVVGLQLAMAMSMVIAAVSGFYCRNILWGMQIPGNVFNGAYDYLFVTPIGIPHTFFYNLLANIMRALGDNKILFWSLLFSMVLNVFLGLFCILVLGWGVMGAAIATVFSQGLSAILCYLYTPRKLPILRTTSSGDRRFHAGLARTLLAMGVPMGLQFSITVIGSIMLQNANNTLGAACVAVFTSTARIKMFFICAFESLGITIATYCGQNYGAGKPERALQEAKVSALMTLTYAAATWMILMPESRWLALLFTAPSKVGVPDYTEQFLHISHWFFPAAGLLYILRYAIQGVDFSSLAMFSGVSEVIVRILVGLYAAPAFGFLGVYFDDPLIWVAADLSSVPASLYVYKKIKKRLDDEEVSASIVRYPFCVCKECGWGTSSSVCLREWGGRSQKLCRGPVQV